MVRKVYISTGSSACLILATQPGTGFAPEDKVRHSPRAPFIVFTSRWLNAGVGHQRENTMTHDKIQAAARKRMAKTGESYVAARYAVIMARKGAQGAASTSTLSSLIRAHLSIVCEATEQAAGIGSFADSISTVADLGMLSQITEQIAEVRSFADAIRDATSFGTLRDTVGHVAGFSVLGAPLVAPRDDE